MIHSEQVYNQLLNCLLRRLFRRGDWLHHCKIANRIIVCLIPFSNAQQRLSYECILTTRQRHRAQPGHDLRSERSRTCFFYP